MRKSHPSSDEEELRILAVVLRHVPPSLRIPTGDDDVSVQGAVAIVFLDALGEDRRTACDEERDAHKEREKQPSRGGSCPQCRSHGDLLLSAAIQHRHLSFAQGSIGLSADCYSFTRGLAPSLRVTGLSPNIVTLCLLSKPSPSSAVESL